MNRIRLLRFVFGGVMTASFPIMAASGRPVTLEERARGARRVVVATVTATSARYERNEFGDEVIVTHAQLAIEEILKGEDGPATLALEGGTVDGITMRVASLPTLVKGERAVFYLTDGPGESFRPHLRGQGIIKLGADNRVRGTSLDLEQIRQSARPAGK